MSRQRVVRWTLGLLGSLVLVLAGAHLLVHSQGFERYAIRKLARATNEATGGRTDIQHFHFQPATLTATLDGVTVRGNDGPGEPPLLRIEQLTVRLNLQSLIRRRITLREFLIERPIVHLRVDKQGESNLPRPAASRPGSQGNVFDLSVGHTLLTNGEIYVDDRAVPLTADLYGLKAGFRFDPSSNGYMGEIVYDRGQVGGLQYPSLAHALTAKLSLAPALLAIDAVLRVGGSTAAVRGQISDYSHPKIEGQYDLRIHINDFNAASPQLAPAGDVSFNGAIHYQGTNDQPWIRNLSLNGSISSTALTANVSEGRLDLRSLSGTYDLSNGTLQTRNLRAETLGGRVEGNIQVEHLDHNPAYRVRAALHDLSLEAAQRTLHAEAGRVTLQGRASGTLDASSTGTLQSTIAHAVLRLRADSRAVMPSPTVPVNGLVDAAYDGPRQQLILRHTTLSIPSTTLTAEGQLSRASDVRITARTSDLKQLTMLASAVRGSKQSQLPEITGSAVLNASARGAMQLPQVAGQLEAQHLQVQGSEWSRASIRFRVDPSQFVVDQGTLVSAHQGTASFSGSVGLRHWSYLASNPISGRLSVQQASVADLQRLADQHYPVDGNLSGALSIRGSQLDPTGTGTLTVTSAHAYGEPIDKVSLEFEGKRGSIHSKLNLASNSGDINAQLSYIPKTRSYVVHLEAPSLALQKLHTIQAKNLDLGGIVSVSADGKGTLDDPQVSATLQVTKLQLRRQPYSDVQANLRVADHRAEVTLHSDIARAPIQAHGSVNLTANHQAELQVDSGTIPLGPLLAGYIPSIRDGFEGQVEIHGTFKGPLSDKSQMQGSINVPVFRAQYQSLQIGTAKPLRANLSRSMLTIEPTEIQGTGTSLRIEGDLPLGGTTPATLRAKGTLDAQILRIVRPELQSSGTVSLDIHATGSGSTWGTQGQIRLQNIAASSPDAPMGVEKLNGILDVSSDKIQVSQVTAEVGGGEVNLGGSITYRPQREFNLALRAKSVRFRYPDGVRTLLGGNLALTGTTDAAALNGKILVENLSFTPDFDLAKFGDQFESAVPSQPSFTDNIKLQVAIQSTGQLSATSSQVSLEGRLNLQAIGTVANPVIIGRADLTGGELFYRNVRYQLQRGIITFDNPTQTNPVMNVAVGTTVQQYNLTLTMRGPLNKLTTSYVSDPPLATADIINLLARGHTTQETNAAAQGTDALIASQAASQVSNTVQKIAGISSLEIDPLIGGNGHNPSARLAIQQRVTKNFLFTFSTDVSQPGSEIVQGDYQFSKRWSVSVARDQLGGVSVDGRYHTKF